MITTYKINPNSPYALYTTVAAHLVSSTTLWKESASITNDEVDEVNAGNKAVLVSCNTKSTGYTSTLNTSEVLNARRIDQMLDDNKYARKIVGLDGVVTVIDVYRVLDAFPTENPQIQHLIKKALATGKRGHKDIFEDLLDIQQSINSAIEMYKQKEGV